MYLELNMQLKAALNAKKKQKHSKECKLPASSNWKGNLKK
jgi:hypothetical protein